MTNQQKASLEKKEKIFRTAITLFQRNGFHQTTITDICKATGMTVGSIYHFYDGKEGILLRLYEDLTNSLPFADDLDACCAIPMQTMMDYALLLAKTLEELGPDLCSQIYWVLFNRIYLHPERSVHIKTPPQNFITFLRTAQERGNITQSLCAEEIAGHLFTYGRGIINEWCLHRGVYSLQEMVKERLPHLLSLFLVEKAPKA